MWVVTLIRELGRGGKEASPHLLTPLAALDEVIATAGSVASGRSQIREADRLSLGKDVSASLRSLGPAVQKVSGAVLRAFQSDDLRRLPQLLADVDGARRARSSTKALIAELLLPRTSRAAWDDVVQAFETRTPFETCTVRIAQLHEISARRGQSWDAVERQLVGVLSDRLLYVAQVGAVDVEITNENLNDPAGLSLERRIELCQGVVSDAPVEEHSIVWMVFGHAALRRSFLRMGPVQFFSGDLPLTAIRDSCPALDTPEFERPAELEHPMAETFLGELPERPFVFARVDVDSRHVADVRRFARDLVSGLVEIAHRDTAWLLFEGEAVFTAGRVTRATASPSRCSPERLALYGQGSFLHLLCPCHHLAGGYYTLEMGSAARIRSPATHRMSDLLRRYEARCYAAACSPGPLGVCLS